jgi:hypothetical protein
VYFLGYIGYITRGYSCFTIKKFSGFFTGIVREQEEGSPS